MQIRNPKPDRAHPGTTTKAGSYANRNAGFIRQAGEWHWGCRINPAFRWQCQNAPTPTPENRNPNAEWVNEQEVHP